MHPDTIHQNAIENYLSDLLKDDQDVFLVNFKINTANDIKVFLDADSGITIEKCTRVNRALYKRIEENNLFTGGDFSLEVSSPGIEEPLKLLRQYKKNIGRTVQVTLNDGAKKIGKLKSVCDDEITIEEKTGQGKKAFDSNRDKITNILFNQIKHVKVQVTF